MTQDNIAQKRGATTVEALLSLTVLILVWAGVSFVGSMYGLKLRTQSQARSCAFRISANACKSIPPECKSAVSESSSGGETEDELKEVTRGGGRGGLWTVIESPLLDQVTSLFSERTSARASAEMDRPALLGGDSATVAAGYSLPCNTKKSSVGDLANDMMKKVLGK